VPGHKKVLWQETASHWSQRFRAALLGGDGFGGCGDNFTLKILIRLRGRMDAADFPSVAENGVEVSD